VLCDKRCYLIEVVDKVSRPLAHKTIQIYGGMLGIVCGVCHNHFI
tara:strand:+ start:80 stop:214 length:135 start_codon:yes stop_codon:yes gene_type:complete